MTSSIKAELDFMFEHGKEGIASDSQLETLRAYLLTHHTGMKRPANPKGRRSIRLKLLANQNDKCSCCGITHQDYHSKYQLDCSRQEDAKYCFVLEHDHKTDEIRGVTCAKCNMELWYYLGE